MKGWWYRRCVVSFTRRAVNQCLSLSQDGLEGNEWPWPQQTFKGKQNTHRGQRRNLEHLSLHRRHPTKRGRHKLTCTSSPWQHKFRPWLLHYLLMPFPELCLALLLLIYTAAIARPQQHTQSSWKCESRAWIAFRASYSQPLPSSTRTATVSCPLLPWVLECTSQSPHVIALLTPLLS